MQQNRPGLKRARPPSLVRVTERVATHAPQWRALFAAADVVSEGMTRHGTAGPEWMGSTSCILLMPDRSPVERAFLAEIARHDGHVRLHAVRLARIEAQARAPGWLGTITAEVRVAEDPRGVRIDVDVEASLSERRRSVRAGP